MTRYVRRNSPGSLATFAAIRRASSLVRSFARRSPAGLFLNQFVLRAAKIVLLYAEPH